MFPNRRRFCVLITRAHDRLPRTQTQTSALALDGFKPSSGPPLSLTSGKTRLPGSPIDMHLVLPAHSERDGFKPLSYSQRERQTLLHCLFPVVRAEVLRLLFGNTRHELYMRELASLSLLSLHTVQDEPAKLEAADLVVSRGNG